MSTYNYPWHLCPAGWWGAAVSKGGYAWFCKHEPKHNIDGEIHSAGDLKPVHERTEMPWRNSAMPIPEREAELNRAVTKYKYLHNYHMDADRSPFKFTTDEFNERRYQRIEAGLVYIVDTVNEECPFEIGDKVKRKEGVLFSGCERYGYAFMYSTNPFVCKSPDATMTWELLRPAEMELVHPKAEQSKSAELKATRLYAYEIIKDTTTGKPPINGQNYLNLPSLTTEQQNAVEDYAINLSKGTEPQEQEWENGVPPIGETCEVTYQTKKGKEAWLPCFIVGKDSDGHIVFQLLSDEVGELYDSYEKQEGKFRKTQTAAERKREKLYEKLLHMMSTYSTQPTEDIANEIIDYLKLTYGILQESGNK